MEALHSCLTTGEQSGGQEHRKPESPSLQTKSPSEPCKQQQTGSPKHHGKLQQAKRPKRQHPERKRLRHQRQSIDSDTRLEQQHEATTAIKATQVSSLAPGVPPPSAGCPTQIKPETQEGTPKQKRERKPQRPGKYVCTYCGRACAKPSVLQKHIRSHTGERPYPCAPCGFSFKTKSNLYKHRKSHTHRVKAGLALGQPRSLEEQVTESEDETRQLSSASSRTEGPSSVTSIKKDCTGGNNDSHAVKRRLAMRLSRGKHSPRGSSDEKESSLILGSKGSTESGYFSRSESTEHSQDTPQNTSNKSYEEIILGKYGRLGHLQRMSRHQNQQPSGQEDKSIPFTVPKKQVIDHITKLITINEAVVDTSKIDSVKPRRFSLSRKNSSESQKSSSTKEPLIHNPKAGDPGYKTSGSITMGVPCEKFQNPSLNVEQPAGQTSGPLVRSQSMPSAAISFDASGCDSSKFRTSQSFDERKPSERQVSRRCGMLRRQPAIEIPLGAELTKEEHEGSHSFYPDSLTTVPDQKQSLPQLYECEACGTGCKDWEGYKKHKQTQCLVHHPRSEMLISQVECSQLINPSVRAGASIMRKRRKEESFESDDPVSPSLPPPLPVSGQCKDESNLVYEGPRRPTLHTCSVIQHTSSFENQESLCNENQGTEATKTSQTLEEFNSVPQNQPQQVSTKSKPRKLVRQYNVQVPEILVTEDSNMSAVIPIEPTPTAKHSEKPDEFQWPQRSPSLSQVPIEKLPPKKKRLRLAEAAQSSGESSFDSVSRPHSPSQDSSASYASSRSTSFEESNRPDMEKTTLTPLRKSRASHMLTVPGVHQQREMRRSASEQAPHDPQPSVLVVETRSKSFDYSCLSPERSAAGWKERRKCLLMRHTAIRDPDEEEEEQCTLASCSPQHVISTTSSLASPNSLYCSKSPASSFSEETVLSNPVRLRCKEIFPQWNVGQNTQSTGGAKGELSLTQCTSVDPVNEETSDTHAGEPHAQALQPYYTQGPSGAARAGYLPMSTGLKLEIPLLHEDYPEVRISTSNIPHPAPHITPSQELLRPVTSPTVAVRLQTDTLTLACAIYTTLSQVASPRLEEMVGAVSYNIAVPTAEYRAHGNISPNLQLWSDDGLRISGSGGNKRMLSPSHSIELPTESQQQQKRVKEEEEREVGCVDNASVVACNQELKVENPTCLPSVCTPYKHAESSFPSLLSSTCNSWCYLNYIKSNPSPLDENKPSVYSSWSTSGYDPNPPGLSSKTALSLLHCKQKRSPSIYTVSPMTIRMAESAEPEDKQRPCSLEVCRDHDGTRMGPQSAGDNRSTQKEEEKEEEEVPSRNEPPDVWNSREGGSVEKYATVQDGGGGKNRCEDYGFQVKDTTERQKCTQGLSETPEHNCKNCEAPFKSKGIYEEPLIQPDKEKDNWFSDQGERGHDEDDTTKDKEGRSDQVSRSKVPDGSASCDAEKSQQKEPEARCSSPLPPKYSTEWSSASLRRALFARRHLNASASTSSAAVLSPSNPTLPQREPSPTRPHQSPAASSSCDVSTSSVKPAGSPSRRLSPVIIQSLGSVSSGPSGSLMDKSARCHACLHPREQASTARRSVNEVGLSPVSPNPGRSWGSHNLLSHLPLHSQQLSRAPSLLIPIGGIHMIQPRSLLPLYSLVSRPKATPTGTSWRGRSSLLLRQDTLKETLPSSPSSPRDPEESGGTPGSGPSDASSQGNSHARGPQPSKTETDAYVTEGPVHPETTLGQKKAPSSQTQL